MKSFLLSTVVATLTLLSAAPARADRYWDVPAVDAAAMAKELTEGTVIVTWCEQCAGDLRILRVRKASVAPGTYANDEGQRSILLERDLLFVGTATGQLSLPKAARCGAVLGDWTDPGDGASSPGPAEHLDIPYSYRLDKDGTLVWLGARVGPIFGYDQGVPPLRPDAAFVAMIRACASDAAAGRLTGRVRGPNERPPSKSKGAEREP